MAEARCILSVIKNKHIHPLTITYYLAKLQAKHTYHFIPSFHNGGYALGTLVGF